MGPAWCELKLTISPPSRRSVDSRQMCHVDIAKLYLKSGDPHAALKSFVKTREFNSTGQQMLEMCMSIIEVSPPPAWEP